MIWVTIAVIIFFLFLVRYLLMRYPQDLTYQWMILSSKDPESVRELVRRRRKQLDVDEQARFFTHDTIRYHKGRIYLPLSLYFFIGLPGFRVFPKFVMWFFLNLQYKMKVKGKGFLWPVPKTILINEHLKNETIPKD